MGKRNGNDRRRRESVPAEINPAFDGADPALFFSSRYDGGRGDRKTQQICKEVERTLGYALGACGDPLLGELAIVEVAPAPDASRLMVTLYASRPGLAASELLERLDSVKGHFRQEVAAALQRKRTPELTFRLTAPELPDFEGAHGDDGDDGDDSDDSDDSEYDVEGGV